MKEVANKAGTSVYTVSSVINNSNPVSLKLRRRVKKAIEELDYVPNAMAKGLKKSRTYSIAVIISDMSDIFYSKVIKSIEKIINLEKLSVTVCNTNNDPGKEKGYLEYLIQNKVDGLIVFTVGQNDESLKKVLDKKIPLVLIDREIETLKVNSVVMDDFNSILEATNYLMDMGHKRIGIVSYPITFSTGRKRIEGYKAALSIHGIDQDVELIKICGTKISDSYKATEELLSIKDVPTAIITTNPKMFIGAFKSIRHNNLKIPEDISLLAVDIFEWVDLVRPSITIIKEPVEKMGEHAAKLLLEEIKSEEEMIPRKIVLSTKLIVGNSVKNISSLH